MPSASAEFCVVWCFILLARTMIEKSYNSEGFPGSLGTEI
jgi:hypothetical protein